MNPIRVDAAIVEPVTLADMRAHLRLDPDITAEDGLVESLIASARAMVELATRRVLAPGRYRVMLTAWPRDGFVPLPLSPLVALASAGSVDAAGTVTAFDSGLVRLAPDTMEAPGLVVSPALPALDRAAAFIEVDAGYGGAGPPVPPALVQAIRLLAAHGFENRGDLPVTFPPMVEALIAPHRRMRL
ncbi:phage head-tail connector protein [Methylobacterium sp. E-045]|uniref:head-tail connector protein n=1 Tax=Methylobacterium sp. E-045 TaxID=2836575 RepID=UPI001FBA9190|nr:phage head-tail connector protein [Methylobacterium sp. E-045]MCJ2128026.1 phage head-tail connector protein [Methylobacterium sp. E-045]